MFLRLIIRPIEIAFRRGIHFNGKKNGILEIIGAWAMIPLLVGDLGRQPRHIQLHTHQLEVTQYNYLIVIYVELILKLFS